MTQGLQGVLAPSPDPQDLRCLWPRAVASGHAYSSYLKPLSSVGHEEREVRAIAEPTRNPTPGGWVSERSGVQLYLVSAFTIDSIIWVMCGSLGVAAQPSHRVLPGS